MKKYGDCVNKKVEVNKAERTKKKKENDRGRKTRVQLYGNSWFHLAPGQFRVSKNSLLTCSLLWTERTRLSWAKQITAASILPCYCCCSNPLNKWLNNLLAGWLTDTHSPAAPSSALSARALHIILPPPLSPSLCIAHFLFFFPPLCHSPVLSFHFGINPFHPSGSFSSSLTFFFFFFFKSLLVLFLSDFFIQALCAIAPHGNCTGHVILALHVILGFTAGWP